MAALIVLEVVANPPPEVEAVRALVEGCTTAATPGGCALLGTLTDEQRASQGRHARVVVVVSFAVASSRVRVELLARPATAGAVASTVAPAREVVFRAEDPVVERYRAAGLVAAGLVSDLAGAEQETAGAPLSPPDGAAEATRRPIEALLRLGGRIGWNASRPRAGAELGADFAVAGPAFVALSGSYGQTWSRDSQGIAEQRASIGAGVGLAASAFSRRLELRVRVEVDLQQVRASIVQPSTNLEDAGGRGLAGVEAGADLLVPLGPSFGAFAGGRLAWWGADTAVRVAGRPAETIGAWSGSIAAGIDVRLP